MSETTRRSFLKTCGTALAGWTILRPAVGAGGEKPPAKPPAAAPGDPAAGGAAPVPRSRVVLARRPGLAGSDFSVKGEGVGPMFEAAMRKATGEKDLAASFRALFRAEDRVGIKVNTIAGPGLSSHPELVACIVGGLRAAGVPDRNIRIWDRTDRELRRVGFTLSREGTGPFCLGTEAEYEEEPWKERSISSRYSRLLTRGCTALINVPVLKDHGMAGITGALKNHYGSIDNPGDYHGGHGNPYIAELSLHPAIRERTRLVVCDGLVAQFHGGPGFRPQYAWPHSGLIVSTDPVALDRVQWKILEEKRAEHSFPSFEEDGRRPDWIAEAARLGLGVADLARIEIAEA